MKAGCPQACQFSIGEASKDHMLHVSTDKNTFLGIFQFTDTAGRFVIDDHHGARVVLGLAVVKPRSRWRPNYNVIAIAPWNEIGRTRRNWSFSCPCLIDCRGEGYPKVASGVQEKAS